MTWPARGLQICMRLYDDGSFQKKEEKERCYAYP
jgi:hypothetical protein